MIHSGRKRQDPTDSVKAPDGHRSAKMVAILGILVFTVFFCSSVDRAPAAEQSSSTFGEGAYQVFAPVDGTVSEGDQKDAAIIEDDSVWSYLESVIARFIYGER